jgi:hypothetical protein
MPMILFCLVQDLLPNAETAAREVETYAAMMALGIFAFVFCRLRFGSRSR